MFIINRYKPSKGAKRLARALKGRVYQKGDYVRRDVDTVINWGDSECPLPDVLNPPSIISRMSNKRTAFDVFSSAGVPIPRYAKTKEGVTWQGTTVVRNKLTGHSGEGIEIHEDNSRLPDAPLYVEYIKKEHEYRVHAGRSNGQVVVIAVQRKARSYSVPEGQVNWRVRSHQNGFVYVREGFTAPSCVLQAATLALSASGLDFGAVDVIYNTKENKAYVLEINTAPGIEGQTIEDYRDFFLGLSG